METYDFDIRIAFRVTADNKHDALQAALEAEDSLNTSAFRASYGGRTTVKRVKAPTISRFRKTGLKMPNEPVQRSVREEISRRNTMLTPLLTPYRVTLDWRGDTQTYPVEAPTRERAIEKARTKFYHERSHMGADVVVMQVTTYDLTNSNTEGE